MLLPSDLLSTASITAAKAGHLLLALDRDGALIWIAEENGAKFAVFLTGEYAGRGFEIGKDAGGFGVEIGPVHVRVDVSSASNEGADFSLRARDGVLALKFSAEANGGFPETRWAPVATIGTDPESTIYFSRWAMGVEVELEWEEVLSAGDGKLSSSL